MACPSGWVYVQVVDGGSWGDKELRRTEKCPLGRTTRMVLHVLLKSCRAFGRQMDGSGVSIAMDNYFTSATLLLCLASHDIFAVGTVRKNRIGMDGALQFWAESKKSTVDRGDMLFARNGFHAHLRERLRAAGVQVSYLFWQYRLADRPVSDDVGIHLEQ